MSSLKEIKALGTSSSKVPHPTYEEIEKNLDWFLDHGNFQPTDNQGYAMEGTIMYKGINFPVTVIYRTGDDKFIARQIYNDMDAYANKFTKKPNREGRSITHD